MFTPVVHVVLLAPLWIPCLTKSAECSCIRLKDVMFVLGLKKNLIFVAILEDHGCEVILIKGKAFLRHIATGQVKQIGVRVKNLYNLDVEDYVALSTKAEKV